MNNNRKKGSNRTVFMGNLPAWVTAEDIQSWLDHENITYDEVKVIRDFETQESKGYAFIEAATDEDSKAIIARFNHAPLEDRNLRVNEARGAEQGRKPVARPRMKSR
jgi:RNA recognition motif-containing protein